MAVHRVLDHHIPADNFIISFDVPIVACVIVWQENNGLMNEAGEEESFS
jgi:hypothetical protein